jgi:putative transposase
MKLKYRKQSNCVYYCVYHIVISSKYRRKIFNAGIGRYLGKIMEEIRKFHPELDMLEYNYDKDHIHIMLSIPPKYSVGKVVGIIKANTARRLREKFPDFLKKVYWGNEGIWSSGYFVSTVGINEEIIKKYIECQGEEDEGRTEFVTD